MTRTASGGPFAHDLILFDLDGTLTDPLVGIGRSINHALTHFSYAPLTLDQVGTYIGPPIDETFRAITASPGEAHITELVSKYRERYAEIGYAETTVYPDVPATLAQLHSTGIPLAICTSKRADFAEKVLALFALRSYFQFVSGGDVGIAKWQQIQALRQQGLVTGDSVMVGDRAVDMVAAHRNGLPAAGVLWGYGSPAELSAETPEYLFKAPPEVMVLAPRREPG